MGLTISLWQHAFTSSALTVLVDPRYIRANCRSKAYLRVPRNSRLAERLSNEKPILCWVSISRPTLERLALSLGCLCLFPKYPVIFTSMPITYYVPRMDVYTKSDCVIMYFKYMYLYLYLSEQINLFSYQHKDRYLSLIKVASENDCAR